MYEVYEGRRKGGRKEDLGGVDGKLDSGIKWVDNKYGGA
jgi:hypothetical protein